MSRRARTYDLAIDRARGRVRCDVAAVASALVVLFNILAAGLLGAEAQAAGSPLLTDLSGDGVVICTGAGMIVVDRNGKPIDDPSGAPHRTLCPFCLPLMQGHAKAPDPVAAAPAPVSRQVAASRPRFNARPAALQYASAAQPRAPPIV
ncbi:DUF2946 family protein [Rhodoblastus acidophilus]|uniref:DUF2946 family protein n=1 Tax=Candidatus Rhodoblastus alkanivorans TaxID=2954117 RepID=A0ABS9Z727_9HYPH|nr:DUF2946 family protein [Candidatus Rhodoblastus alkanivorans]MCI4678734.1 DUF2946 family protein [Candidatus Rhodoblastus alkanivorans]MCI4683470.1 DUF2946 family protein [Candidatus Rhodoblastus alkanivorans]MDI4640784.1 DUF2946 family protein [Rhodoblastus acidophilus]